MQIERQQSLSVVDYDKVAFKEKRLGQDDASAIHGLDRCATGHAEIKPLMRALNRAVKNALDSKQIRDLGIHRRRKRSFPFTGGGKRFKSLGLNFFALLNLALVFGAGRGVARWNCELYARIALLVHSNFP